MKHFSRQAERPGTGECLCRTHPEIRVYRTNQILDRTDAILFSAFIGFEYEIIWGSEKKKNYGWACSHRNVIKLNRICVGTFLHELAHLMASKLGSKGHDVKFAFVLDSLYSKWAEYEEAKAAIAAK